MTDESEKKKIYPQFCWVDDEVAEIKCPNCGKNLSVDIYADRMKERPCECGKVYVLKQDNWVEEL